MKIGQKSLFVGFVATGLALLAHADMANAQSALQNVNFKWTVAPAVGSSTVDPTTCSGAFVVLGGTVTLTQTPDYNLPSLSIVESPTFQMNWWPNTPLNKPTGGFSSAAWDKVIKYDEAVFVAFEKYMNDQCNADQTKRFKSPWLPPLKIPQGNIKLSILANQ